MKTLVKCLISVLIVAGILFALLPQIASTKWGAPYVLRLLDRDLPGAVSAEKLQLSWRGPQKAQVVEWKSDRVNFSAPKIESSTNLFALLFYRDLETTIITEPELYLSGETLKTVPLQQARLLPPLPTSSWIGTIEIQKGLVQYEKEQLTDVNARIEKTKSLIALELKAARGKEQIECKANLSLEQKAFSVQGISSSETGAQAVWEFGGKFDRGNIIEWRSGAKNFPTSTLELAYRLLTKQDFFFSKILGKQADFTFNYDQNGPVEGALVAPQAEAKVTGKMEEGVLHLDAPLEAQLLLSNALSQYFFPPDNPYGIRQIYSNQPVKLTVAPAGSAIPFHPWNPRSLSLSAGRIDLSVVTCHMPGSIGQLFNFLHTEKQRVAPIELWFSPLDFSAANGQVAIDRTDFLMDRTFHLCFWGEYNLIKDRLKLTLGITAATLHRALKIDGLPEDYVLQIPVKLQNHRMKIDFKKAAEKIAKIMLWYKACQLDPPVVLPLPDEKKPAPPPKLPLPWDLVLS